jgi:hypothetical protein
MAAVGTPAWAGGFVTLTTTPPLRKFGAQNPAADQFKLAEGVSTGGGNYAPPSNLTQLEARQSSIMYQGSKVGTLFDFVFRDTTDNQLVFGSRVVLEPIVNGQANIFEINDFYRSGNNGFTIAAAWSRGSDLDLRMYSAARTTKDLLGGADTFDPDIVNMRSDINVSEGNPRSGYYYLRSSASHYTLSAGTGTCGATNKTYGFRIRQSGEEQQPITDICFDAFVPSSQPPAVSESVPIPLWALVMLAAGLALAGLRARRR